MELICIIYIRFYSICYVYKRHMILTKIVFLKLQYFLLIHWLSFNDCNALFEPLGWISHLLPTQSPPLLSAYKVQPSSGKTGHIRQHSEIVMPHLYVNMFVSSNILIKLIGNPFSLWSPIRSMFSPKNKYCSSPNLGGTYLGLFNQSVEPPGSGSSPQHTILGLNCKTKILKGWKFIAVWQVPCVRTGLPAMRYFSFIPHCQEYFMSHKTKIQFKTGQA